MPRKNLTCPKYFSNVCQINNKACAQSNKPRSPNIPPATRKQISRQILRGYDNVEHQNSQSNPRRSLFAKKCSYAPLQFTLYVAFVRALGPRRLEKYEAEEPDMLLHGAIWPRAKICFSLKCGVHGVVFTVYLATFSAFRGGFCSDAPNNFFRCCFVM